MLVLIQVHALCIVEDLRVNGVYGLKQFLNYGAEPKMGRNQFGVGSRLDKAQQTLSRN